MKLLKDVDVLLRGGFTRKEDLARGHVPVPTRALILGGLLLGALYGLFMGLYGVSRPDHATVLQLLADIVKVPLLFLLTLAVTVPSLYVFSTLASCPLPFVETLRLLLAAIAVNLAVLASLGPVVAFFTLSTESYPFMVVLNIIFFTVSGVAGLVFLKKALDLVFAGVEPLDVDGDDAPRGAGGSEEGGPAAGREASPREDRPWQPGRSAVRETAGRRRALEQSHLVFRSWIVIYGVVGAQMGWILRPFVGAPDLPFTLFRERESSFFGGFWEALRMLFQ